MIETPDPRVPLTSPCPCGSGRKYKRCCWPVEKRKVAEARAAIRDSTAQVGAYAAGFDREMTEFEEFFFGPAREEFDEDEFEEYMDQVSETVTVAFMDIFAADYVLRSGWTVIERFLDDPKASGGLHPAAREYVKLWGQASLGLYEVQEVVFGESLVLKDLFTRRSVTVVEHSASQSLNKWDALFTRVVRMGDVGLLTGPILTVPRRKLQWIIDSLKKVKDDPGDRTVTWARFFKKHWNDVPYLWFLMWVAPMKGLELRNFDGHQLCEISVTYSLVEGGGARAAARLNAMEELSRDDRGAWSWIEERERGTMENVSLAFVSVDGDSVVLQVNSRERETLVRERIDGELGELVVKADRSEEAIDFDSLERGSDSAVIGQRDDEIPPDVQRQVVHQMLSAHYRRWLDEPVPALDGLTPREAVKDRKMRQRVISLLKDIEVDAARRGPDDPGAGFDFGWLWGELSIRRTN